MSIFQAWSDLKDGSHTKKGKADKRKSGPIEDEADKPHTSYSMPTLDFFYLQNK